MFLKNDFIRAAFGLGIFLFLVRILIYLGAIAFNLSLGYFIDIFLVLSHLIFLRFIEVKNHEQTNTWTSLLQISLVITITCNLLYFPITILLNLHHQHFILFFQAKCFILGYEAFTGVICAICFGMARITVKNLFKFDR